MKIAVWGIGVFAERFKLYCDRSNDYEIVVAFDNKFQGLGNWKGVLTAASNQINDFEFEKIFIITIKEENVKKIKEQLQELGISKERIVAIIEDEIMLKAILSSSIYAEKDPRVSWLRNYARYVSEENIDGAVAECGVNWGDFSMYINQYFKDRKLYLFDTFEGFASKDLEIERSLGDNQFLVGNYNSSEAFSYVQEEYVLNRMPYKDKCEIRRGYFPSTTQGLEKEKFCFVNLDMDLYIPQIEGLRFFFDKMVEGGVILLHDYFCESLPGVKKAVKDWLEENGRKATVITIGDDCSIAVIK